MTSSWQVSTRDNLSLLPLNALLVINRTIDDKRVAGTNTTGEP